LSVVLNSCDNLFGSGYFVYIRYGDGAGNTIEENYNIFSLIRMR